MATLNWQDIDTVLLDMDGTMLDLAYDNFFWNEHVPVQYMQKHQMGVEEMQAQLLPHFEKLKGTLQWYCTDHWSTLTGLNIRELKQQTTDKIRLLPTTHTFLQAVRAMNPRKKIYLVTNAHPDSLSVKLAHTDITPYFDGIFSVHNFGAPKESQAFWQAFHAQNPFDPARTLLVEDTLPILDAAEAFGIAYRRAIAHPDTRLPPREIPAPYVSVMGLGELV